ncbi:MAG: site-specific integrase [Planctomycetes bacterium]|nr:site-specific integrase [Planctomycetota bacterium]
MAKKRRGRGEGSICQLPSGRWYADMSFGLGGNGRRVRKRVYGDTKNEVMEKMNQLKNDAARGFVSDTGAMTVGAFLDQWLAAVKPTITRGTFAGYEQHVRNLLKPHVGGVRLAKFNSLHVQGMYRALADAKHSTAMQRKAGIALRAALSWGVKLDLVKDNPAKRVTMPKHDKPEATILEPEQTAAFLKAANEDRLYALYVLAIDSGCRQGELLALIWRDVDFERGTISITKSLEEVHGVLAIKPPKTKKARRTITLSAFTLEALAEHRQAMLAEGSYKPDAPIFCGSRSGSYLRKSDVYRHSFEPILNRAGLSFRFHDLRHSCASMLLVTGTDIKTVQERLGHSTPIQTLNTYSHVMAGSQSAAAEKLNAILASASSESRSATG